MKTRFTPGPWVVHRNSAFWEVNPANGGDDGLPFTVADVCSSAPGDPDGGLQEANARLIAASPEMHDALVAIETVLKGHPLAEVGNSTVHCALRRARAALILAQGDQL